MFFDRRPISNLGEVPSIHRDILIMDTRPTSLQHGMNVRTYTLMLCAGTHLTSTHVILSLPPCALAASINAMHAVSIDGAFPINSDNWESVRCRVKPSVQSSRTSCGSTLTSARSGSADSVPRALVMTFCKPELSTSSLAINPSRTCSITNE